MKSIYVFKTSVGGPEALKKLKPVLNRLINHSGRWSFDLEDCDKILRVESRSLEAERIASALRLHGYECEELMF